MPANSGNKLRTSAHTVDTDELIRLLEEAEVTEEGPIDYENDVLNFIATFAIEPGLEKIKAHTLFLIYKVWSKNPLKKTEFHKKIGNYLESTNLSTSRGYLVNQNSIKLTHSAYKYFSNKHIRINSKVFAKQFENFLKFHSLTKGEYYVDHRILYFIYDRFTHATGLERVGGNKLSEKSFKIYCKIYLPEKETKHGTMYGVSSNIVQFFQIGQLDRLQKEYAQEEKSSKRRPSRGFKSKSKSKNKV